MRKDLGPWAAPQQVPKTFRETSKAEQGPPDSRQWQHYRETKLDSDGDASSLAGKGWVSENEEEKPQLERSEKTELSGRSLFLCQEQLGTFENELKAENLHEGPFREGECKPAACRPKLGDIGDRTRKRSHCSTHERRHGRQKLYALGSDPGKPFGPVDLELPPKEEGADSSPTTATSKEMKMGHMCVLLHTEWGYL
ncbi:hypothetical protein JRQ81_012153 [Phrynocephalus forsythii]|uniref:Uncharacterized protein n=1 Tax=Phrynocephalus forsythii TaxID=171643 RepID=A0A9Q0X5F5_9SAUR|nr:hypothetical protein JRQ81_012153 [Phrynocephalus forsythii]